MTARARRREEIRCANPIQVFTARCQARALLFEAGEFDLHEAVDVLQTAAERMGLVTLLGQDRVQGLMARAFAPIQIQAIESEAPASPANEPYHLVFRDAWPARRSCSARTTARSRSGFVIACRRRPSMLCFTSLRKKTRRVSGNSLRGGLRTNSG